MGASRPRQGKKILKECYPPKSAESKARFWKLKWAKETPKDPLEKHEYLRSAQATVTKCRRPSALNNRNLFYHCSGGWKVQDQGSGQSAPWWELSSQFAGGYHLAVCSYGTHVNTLHLYGHTAGGEERNKQAVCCLFSSGRWSRPEDPHLHGLF